MAEGNLIDACARLRAEAETEDVDAVLDKIRGLVPLLKDLPAGEQLAASQILDETVQVLEARQQQ